MLDVTVTSNGLDSSAATTEGQTQASNNFPSASVCVVFNFEIGGILVPQYWGGTKHFFLLTLYNFKNIGGARAPPAPLPPPPPHSTVPDEAQQRGERRRNKKEIFRSFRRALIDMIKVLRFRLRFRCSRSSCIKSLLHCAIFSATCLAIVENVALQVAEDWY